MAAQPILFNALNGREVKEIILRKIRDAFEEDTRFRHSVTYPNLKYTFSLKMECEPGIRENVSVVSAITPREKLQAQADVIARLEEKERDQSAKVEEIENQFNLMAQRLEKTERDLADANVFINKLHSDKLVLEKQLKEGGRIVEPPRPSVEEELLGGGSIEVAHESEVIEEPDRLRDAGETISPEEMEVEFSGGGELQGEQITDGVTIGRARPAHAITDDKGKPYAMPSAPARGVTIASERPGAGAAPPGAVKGRPRE